MAYEQFNNYSIVANETHIRNASVVSSCLTPLPFNIIGKRTRKPLEWNSSTPMCSGQIGRLPWSCTSCSNGFQDPLQTKRGKKHVRTSNWPQQNHLILFFFVKFHVKIPRKSRENRCFPPRLSSWTRVARSAPLLRPRKSSMYLDSTCCDVNIKPTD